MKKILNWLKSPKSDFILFLVLLVLINIVGHNTFARLDLTKPHSYSLSKASQTLVKNIDEPLSVRVFFDKNLPSPYNSVSQYVEDFLGEYKRAASKNFTVTFMDVSKPENVELARDFGLRQVQIQEVKNNEVGFKQAYMGIVIAYGDNIETIDPISSADGFEYKLTSTISKMINTADSLAGLKDNEKIKLTVYLSEPLKNLRISGADQIEELVRKAWQNVNQQKMDRIDFNVINPAPEEVAALVEKYGIQSLSYKGADGQRETGALGVVLESKDSFRVLPVEVQQSFFGYAVAGLDDLETSINDNIQGLMSKPTQVGYITGHNELPLDDEKYAANFAQLINGMYELVELDLSEQDIPAGMTCIIINGPQMDYLEEELYKIDQFLMKGGNIMFLVDGLNTLGSNANYYNAPQYMKNEINLDRLLNKYGIKRGYNFIMDKNCYVNNSTQYGKLSMYWAPILQKDGLAKNNPITNNLGYVIMLENGTIDVSDAQANKDLKTTILAKSSPDSWVEEKTDIVLNPITIAPPSDKSVYGAQNLAVLIEGNFESAFDEAPAPETDEEEEETKPALPEDDMINSSHISKSKLPGKIFVTGTSYITTYQVLDADGTSPIGMFLMNTVDYMNGNEDLCAMRTKGLSLNTLTIKSQGFAKVVQYFNEFGLAVLVAIAGLIIWRCRARRKSRINKKYNPDDERFIEKK